MKKVIALILVLITSVGTLVACSNDEENLKKAQDPEQTKKEIQETAEEFIKFYYEGSDEVFGYIVADSPAYEYVEGNLGKFSTFSDILDGFEEDLVAAGVADTKKYVEEVETILDDFKRGVFEILKYKVEEIVINKEEASVSIYVKAPSPSDFEYITNSLDEEDLLLEILSAKDVERMSRVTSADEMMPYLMKFYRGSFAYMIDLCKENTSEGEATFKLIKIDEKWLIQEIEERVY